ncbi:DUF2382 domain-containing protein [Azotobacter chroococcum]
MRPIPQVRQEGDVTVIPVLEEVLVVEKRLVLKEELRVRRVVHEEPHSVPVTLRREQVTVERTPQKSRPPKPGRHLPQHRYRLAAQAAEFIEVDHATHSDWRIRPLRRSRTGQARADE